MVRHVAPSFSRLLHSSHVHLVCSPCALTRLHDCGPVKAAVLVRKTQGRRKVVAPGPAPRSPSTVSIHCGAFGSEQSSPTRGRERAFQGALGGSWFGETHWPCRGPSLQGETDGESYTHTEASSRLPGRTSARTPASLWTASAPTTCTRARWATAGLWQPAHRSPPESRCGRR